MFERIRRFIYSIPLLIIGFVLITLMAEAKAEEDRKNKKGTQQEAKEALT